MSAYEEIRDLVAKGWIPYMNTTERRKLAEDLLRENRNDIIRELADEITSDLDAVTDAVEEILRANGSHFTDTDEVCKGIWALAQWLRLKTDPFREETRTDG